MLYMALVEKEYGEQYEMLGERTLDEAKAMVEEMNAKDNEIMEVTLIERVSFGEEDGMPVDTWKAVLHFDFGWEDFDEYLRNIGGVRMTYTYNDGNVVTRIER